MRSVAGRVARLERRLGARIRLVVVHDGEPLPKVEARPGEQIVFVRTGVPRRAFDESLPGPEEERGGGRP